MGVMRSLSDLLVAQGSCTLKEIEQAETIRQEYRGDLANILLNLGILTEEKLLLAWEKLYGLKRLSAQTLKYKKITLASVPDAFYLEHHLYPIDETDESIFVALQNPLEIGVLSFVSLHTTKSIIFLLATQEELREIRTFFEEDPADEIEEIFADEVDKLKELASEAPVIKLVNNIFSKAAQSGISDIHFESSKQGMKVRYRLDGMLQTVEMLPQHLKQAITARLKLISKMNIAENRLPQDGRITVKIAGNDIDIRASSVPTAFGESFVLRLLSKDAVDLSLDALGLHPDNTLTLKMLLKRPNGIILTTGPTGSGKTSTLYAALNYLYNDTIKIVTVEDPVEYQLEGISQIQVKPTIDYTFAKALRSILRQDPDVIMIGEIRDAETAEIAVQSALTGHLVLSTLHTNSALGAIARLRDIGIEYYLLKSSIIGLMAQRLVRKLCEHCKTPINLTAELRNLYRLDALMPLLTSAAQPCKAVGCDHCQHTGFKGRLPIMEIAPFDETLMQALDATPNLSDLRPFGYRSLQDDGLLKFLEGKTSLDEIIRAVQ